MCKPVTHSAGEKSCEVSGDEGRLPFLTSYRTLCISPSADLRCTFNNLANISTSAVQL